MAEVEGAVSSGWGRVHPSLRSVSREGLGSFLGPAPSRWCSTRPRSRVQTGGRLRATCARGGRVRGARIGSQLRALRARRAGGRAPGKGGAGGKAGEGGTEGARRPGRCSRQRRGFGSGPWSALRAWCLRPRRTVERIAALAAGPSWSRPLPLSPSCNPRSLPPFRTPSPAPCPALAPMGRRRRAPAAPRPSPWLSPSPRCTQRCAPWGCWATCSSCSASSGESAAEWCHGPGPR